MTNGENGRSNNHLIGNIQISSKNKTMIGRDSSELVAKYLDDHSWSNTRILIKVMNEV